MNKIQFLHLAPRESRPSVRCSILFFLTKKKYYVKNILDNLELDKDNEKAVRKIKYLKTCTIGKITGFEILRTKSAARIMVHGSWSGPWNGPWVLEWTLGPGIDHGP